MTHSSISILSGVGHRDGSHGFPTALFFPQGCCVYLSVWLSQTVVHSALLCSVQKVFFAGVAVLASGSTEARHVCFVEICLCESWTRLKILGLARAKGQPLRCCTNLGWDWGKPNFVRGCRIQTGSGLKSLLVAMIRAEPSPELVPFLFFVFWGFPLFSTNQAKQHILLGSKFQPRNGVPAK